MNALRKTIVIVAVAVLCACALAGCGQGGTGAAAGGASMEQRPTITVNATSEVKAVPDKAQLAVSVTTQAGSAEKGADGECGNRR